MVSGEGAGAGGGAAGSERPRGCCGHAAAWASWSRRNYWEFLANVMEVIAIVLVVFFQDVAFKESILATACLLTASFGLHGLAHRAGQCKVFPKVLEIAAPPIFWGLTVFAYVEPLWAYKMAFVIINFGLATAEAAALLAGRNFAMDYVMEWSPREAWGTPLLERTARAGAPVWMAAAVIMGLAQVFVVAFGISLLTSDLALAIVMCYVLQLLPLVLAIAFTIAYPAILRRRWGTVKGVRSTYYPPGARPGEADGEAAGGGGGGAARAASASASAGSAGSWWRAGSRAALLGGLRTSSGRAPSSELDAQMVVVVDGDSRSGSGSGSGGAAK